MTEKWKVLRIEEADYGCEEPAEDEPIRVLVTLQAADGLQRQLLFDDALLRSSGVDEGSDWPFQNMN